MELIGSSSLIINLESVAHDQEMLYWRIWILRFEFRT